MLAQKDSAHIRSIRDAGLIKAILFPVVSQRDDTLVPAACSSKVSLLVPWVDSIHHFRKTPRLQSSLSSFTFWEASKQLLFMRLCPTAQCSSELTSQDDKDRNIYPEADDQTRDLTGGPNFRTTGWRNRSNTNQPITELQVSEWLQQESGMDRLKMMYAIGENGTFAQEDTKVLNKMFIQSVIMGLFLNIFVSAQGESKRQKNLSGTQALIKGSMDEMATTKTLFRETLKNTAKLTVFAGSVLHLSQAIAAYRNQTSVWEYTISSAIGFGAIAIGKGPRQMATLMLGGAVAGTLYGKVICLVLSGAGLDQEQRHMKRIERLMKEKTEAVS